MLHFLRTNASWSHVFLLADQGEGDWMLAHAECKQTAKIGAITLVETLGIAKRSLFSVKSIWDCVSYNNFREYDTDI